MSRGRPRHQASRRRTYSSRQRDLRERQVTAVGWEPLRQVEPLNSTEVDDSIDFDPAPAWPIRLSRRASAA
jgi:hypothetical protein